MAEGGDMLIAYVLMLVAFLDAAFSFLLVTMLLKPVKMLVSLGERMDRYVTIVYLRFAVLISGSLMLLVAYYLSGAQWIVAVFGAHTLFYFLSWPTRSRLSSDLKLKESEKEVIND